MTGATGPAAGCNAMALRGAIAPLCVALALAGCGRVSKQTTRESTGNAAPDSSTLVGSAPGTAPAPDSSRGSAASGALIHVLEPAPGARITSPLQVRGEARGSWYFEGSFGVKLVDSLGNVLDQSNAQAQGEWTTKEFVPFRAVLTFAPPGSDRGRLVLEKSNPSGLASRADSVVIPVRF